MKHLNDPQQACRLLSGARRFLATTLTAGLLIAGTASAQEPLSVIFASDPQLWWGISGATSDDGVTDEEIEAHNKKHTDAMEELINGNSLPSIDYDGDGTADATFSTPTALIINGDLTEYGKWEQWDAFKAMFEDVDVPTYLGLGNHDYDNNVPPRGSCGATAGQILDASTFCAVTAGQGNYAHGQDACTVAGQMIDEGSSWCGKDAMRYMCADYRAEPVRGG